MPFLVFWEDNFCLRCSLNWLPFYAYFYLPGFTYKYSIILFYISCGFKSFLDISFSWVYSLGKIRTDVKIRIFLSRLHIGLDSGFSSKIGRIPQNWDDWTVCGWGLRLRAARGVWWHATIENVIKILTLWNAISSVRRGQFLPKMFAKLIVIFNRHYCLRGFTCKYSTLF